MKPGPNVSKLWKNCVLLQLFLCIWRNDISSVSSQTSLFFLIWGFISFFPLFVTLLITCVCASVYSLASLCFYPGESRRLLILKTSLTQMEQKSLNCCRVWKGCWVKALQLGGKDSQYFWNWACTCCFKGVVLKKESVLGLFCGVAANSNLWNTYFRDLQQSIAQEPSAPSFSVPGYQSAPAPGPTPAPRTVFVSGVSQSPRL